MAAMEGDDGIAVAKFGPEVADEDLVEADDIAIEGDGALHVGGEEHELNFLGFHQQ